MKIGILGSRGIPNYYGGFEECAQQLGTRLVAKGHEVFVYCSHLHPYSQKEFEGIQLIHKYDPENRLGTAGQFIYDFNCIVDSKWRDFDVLLLLGYTSSSIWRWLYPKKPVIINNMDGLEWKRDKYSDRVKQFLLKAERWAAHSCKLMVADAVEIRDYLNKKYERGAVYIPYGASIFKKPNAEILNKYGLEPYNYNLVLARLEPENNIEIILKGVQKSSSERITLVIGNHETTYGEYLKKNYRDSRIRFIKASYKKDTVNNLRYYCNLYFHGHTVGGTNPSLLEAMGCKSMICAHNNAFNQEVLGEEGNYFLDENDVVNALDLLERNEAQKIKIKKNLEKLSDKYNWDIVTDQYLVVFEQSLL
jgi:glycosyltransferase involved in cell wall biosynthesis